MFSWCRPAAHAVQPLAPGALNLPPLHAKHDTALLFTFRLDPERQLRQNVSMRDMSDPESLISSLKADEIADLVKDGTISQGMIPKTDSSVKALRSGVHRVHFVDGENPHSLLLEIFTDKGVGTEIVNA